MSSFKKVLVTGGAGYVGSVLVPRLLAQGYAVKVLDLFIYGEKVFDEVKSNPKLELVKGDIRDQELVKQSVQGCDAVIHLACISNDPSVELNPDLSRTINFEAFGPLVALSKAAGVKRFVFASSGSVYGVSDDPDVTEEHPLVPVSLYNKYKAMCEPVLLKEQSPGFTTVIVRPATICGYSPRQRLDLTVNILTNHAVNTDKITVFGGSQMRPNLHMQDMVDLYLLLLDVPDAVIAGQIFNAAYQNFSVSETAEVVKSVVQKEVSGKEKLQIVTTPSDDIRSYHISSAKIRKVLGFVPKRTIEDGAKDLIAAFRNGKLPDSMSDMHYFNIKMMKSIDLK
ncbi:MAG TPA: UDP-glucose 4-epimerase [Verrucomicrobia bacterium]|nr:MAG: UDP-glucose 4-epimerase [Lentisphaerae bacterium GWF2_57_35]HBA84528.1 UDP-glucose 4-epimerase [Verrucomicrobiota bacterium]